MEAEWTRRDAVISRLPVRSWALACVVTCALIGMPGGGRAGEANPGLDDLISRYLSALRDSDLAALEALHGPLLDRCRNASNQAEYEQILRAEVESYVEADPAIVSEKLAAQDLGSKLDLLRKVTGEPFDFGVPPTHAFEFTARQLHPANHPCASRPARVRKFVARVGDDWWLVPQCLTPSMVRSLQSTRRTQDAVRRMQEDLLAELPAELRTELFDLVGRGQSQAAFERYTEQTGNSRGKALRLVERICQEF